MLNHLFEELELATATGCWEFKIAENSLLWSDQTYRIHGLEIGTELVVEEALNFYHEDDRERIQILFSDCVIKFKPYRDNFRIIDAQGNLKHVEAWGKPLVLDGEVKAIIGTFKDITEKELLNSELEQEREKVASSSQLAAIGEMSAEIAHEIANPLTVIMGQTEIIKRKIETDSPLQERISKIQNSVDRIDKIIRGLKKSAHKSKSNNFELKSLGRVIDDTLDFCEEALKTNHIKLHYEKVPAELSLNCNEIKISQVLLNLLNNSKDSILESDSNEKWIKIIVTAEEAIIKIQIVDSGAGISDENKAKLTESFFTTKSSGKGTGLGLPLVKRFVEEHKGRFYLDDTYPGHTCFTVELPR